MKTVFFLTKNFPPVICGVGDYTYELLARLKAKGYRIKVITFCNKHVSDFIRENNLEKDVYPMIDHWNLNTMKRVINILNQEKPDWFFIHYVPNSFSSNGTPFLLLLFQLLVKLRGVKVGVFFHEVAVRPFHHGLKYLILGLVQRGISYCVYLMSKFSFTSNSLYQSYFKPFAVPVVPIPTVLYGENETINSARQERLQSVRLAVFINRCNNVVLNGFAECVNKDKLNIELIIIGKGNNLLKKDLVPFISSRNLTEFVHFLDKTGRLDIAEAFYVSDIFLQVENVDKRGEGGISSKSTIVAAAMAAGLPIISSAGDMTDQHLFINEHNILMVDSLTAESVRKCINRLYYDKTLRLHLGANALRTYELYFCWERTIHAYLSAFEGF